MTVQEWAAWAVLAALGVVYVIGTAVAAVLSDNGRSRQASPPAGADGIDAPRASVAAAGALTARGAALFAAVGAALALAFALRTTTEGRAWQYAAAGGAMVAALAGLHLATGLGPFRRSRLARRAVAPAAWVFARVAAIPGFPALLGAGAATRASDESRPGDVSAVLAENLERLEQTGIDGDSGELRMIKAVLSMDTARVREIMRPRVDMVTARADATPEQLIAIINDRGHSKIPVYEETIDEIVGVVYARDLLRLQNGNGQGPKTAKDIARPAAFVPESQRLEQLLREFQRHRTQIAIVVDEYGGVSGLVTVQDLIEEIVGEIVDEFDHNEPDVERISELEATMDARVPIDSLNELFGVTVVSEGFDTVGGLVYRELGKMPVVGDTVDVQNLRIAVESTMGRRIRRLRVKRIVEMSDTPV